MTTKTEDSPELVRVKRIIRAMLERTEGAVTEQEALDAAAKVGELLAQYNLTITEVGLRETGFVTKELYAADDAASSIIVGIERLCTLKCYTKGGANVTTFVVFGHEQDVELASYLFEICEEAADHGWLKEMNKYGYSKAKRESYRAGFASRVATRMVDMKRENDEWVRSQQKMSNSTDLLVVKDQLVEAEWQKKGIRLGRSKPQNIKDNSAYNRGWHEGEKVNLRNPIEDGRGIVGAIR